MMQLLCNGVRLDLYENAGLQFTHDNPLFAFDKLSCERTTQFKLPSTPMNDRVLQLARIPAYKGTGMRTRFAAEMQDGVCVKRGYLYVSQFDGTDYAAVFVTGELIGLQEIKTLGKISDIIAYSNVATLGGSPSTPAAAVGYIWRNVSYLHADDISLNPSIELATLYSDILTAHGITAESLPAGADGVRIIPNELSGLKEQTIGFERAIIGNMAADGTYPIVTTATIDISEIFLQSTARVARRVDLYGGGIKVYHGRVAQVKCMQEITLKFPSDWDDDLFVGQFLDGDTQSIGEFEFYGERSFNEYGVITGESLRGRSVEVPFGQYLCVIRRSDYFNGSTSEGDAIGWSFSDGISCTFEASGKVEEVGSYARLQDNLPDMTFTELLKTIAALSGKVLNYSEAEGLTYEDLNFSGYASRADIWLMNRGGVSRTFADYAQRSVVHFDDEQADRLQVAYDIDNVNIELEKDLQVIPFSEGRDSAGLLYVYAGEKMFLGMAAGQSTLSRVTLAKNVGLQALCDRSTQFKVTLRMGMYEYSRITAKTLLIVDNIRYIWTARSWQEDTAQFTLAQVP